MIRRDDLNLKMQHGETTEKTNKNSVWKNGEYFTELITKKSMEYLHSSIQKSNPFFLYIPYNAPHYPMHAPQKYVDRYPDLPWDKQIMAAMISAVDDSLGEIITFLKMK